VEGKCEQIESDEQSGKVLLAVAEVVLEIVAVSFENIEGLILNLPSVRRRPGKGEDVTRNLSK
jgi:hypothetical protein